MAGQGNRDSAGTQVADPFRRRGWRLRLPRLAVLGGGRRLRSGGRGGRRARQFDGRAGAGDRSGRIDRRARPGPPIVLIDPGHGGRDPGAPSVSGEIARKEIDPRSWRANFATRSRPTGRVRVALTRDDDSELTLEQRATPSPGGLAPACLFRCTWTARPIRWRAGASVYSLSEVASDAEAARLRRNRINAGGELGREGDGSVRAILSDLAQRSQMTASADFAERLVRKAAGPGAASPRAAPLRRLHRAAQRRTSPRCCSKRATSAMPRTKPMLRSPRAAGADCRGACAGDRSAMRRPARAADRPALPAADRLALPAHRATR